MSVARVYASVLYSALPAEAAARDSAREALERVAEQLAARADLRAALSGPLTTATEKKGLLTALASRLECGPVVARFLELMARKGRIDSLPDVAAAFRAVCVEAEGGVLGAVDSAETLSESDLADLARAFGQKLGKRVSLTARVRPELLAGLRVTVQGTTYDGSLQSKLQRLKQKFLETSFRNN